MNNEEIIRLEKIKKREKIDTILAYILLIILSLAIVFIIYLKFIWEKPIEEEIEYTPTYISLEEISTSLNSSVLSNRFSNEKAVFNSTVVGDTILVNYSKDETNISLNILKINNELQINIDKENKDIIIDIAKEIGVIVCDFYNKDDSSCRRIIDNVYNTNMEQGIRYFEDENTTSMYIDITRKIDINRTINYTDETKVGITNTEYSLNIENTEISNININNDEMNIIFNGTITNSIEESYPVSVIVRLYDINNNVIGENKYEYTESNPLEEQSSFEVSFVLNDTLKLENITHYSINVVR